MSPQLRQINVSYVEKEDRLILKVSNSDDQEYRLWCTRRFTRLLLDRFEELFHQEVVASTPTTPDVSRDVAHMQHSKSVAEESFEKPYEAIPTDFPLGENGLLVTTFKYTKAKDGGLHLQLTDGGDKGMKLQLNPALQHQFYELIRRAVAKTDWFDAQTLPISGVVH